MDIARAQGRGCLPACIVLPGGFGKFLGQKKPRPLTQLGLTGNVGGGWCPCLQRTSQTVSGYPAKAVFTLAHLSSFICDFFFQVARITQYLLEDLGRSPLRLHFLHQLCRCTYRCRLPWALHLSTSVGDSQDTGFTLWGSGNLPLPKAGAPPLSLSSYLLPCHCPQGFSSLTGFDHSSQVLKLGSNFRVKGQSPDCYRKHLCILLKSPAADFDFLLLAHGYVFSLFLSLPSPPTTPSSTICKGFASNICLYP